MSEAAWLPGVRWRPWQPARHEDAADPLPGIVAVRYAEALAAAEDHYRLGQTAAALKQLALAAALGRHRALPHILAAEIHLEAGRRMDAMTAYRRALEREPTNAAAIAGSGWAASLPALTPPLTPSPASSGDGPGGATAHPTAAAVAAVAVGAVAVATPVSRTAGPPLRSVRLETRTALLVLVPYLALLTVAELAVTFVNPLLVFPLHGGMLAIAAVHVAYLERDAETDPRSRYLAALVMALMLSPLIRIISLTLPLAQIAAPYRFGFAGVPMVIGAVMVARYVGFRPRWIGLIWRGGVWQIVALAASIFLGFIEFAILRPEALGALPWTAAGWLPALSVAIATGFPEELIFRGIMQTAARPLIGSRLGVIYVSLVFAVLHIGYRSPVDFAFVLAVGLFYGWIFERSRSIIGISIGHGVANAVLFFVAPNLLGL